MYTINHLQMDVAGMIWDGRDEYRAHYGAKNHNSHTNQNTEKGELREACRYIQIHVQLQRRRDEGVLHKYKYKYKKRRSEGGGERLRLVHCERVSSLPGGSTAATSTCSSLPLSFEEDVKNNGKIII